MFKEHHPRSLMKTITWRVIATVLTFSVVWFFTGHLYNSMKVVLTAAILSTMLYYAHERVWNHIHWGKRHHPPRT
ncbi:DUF2061 domain-containing protein [Patescibacteria group bacterium]